MPLQRPPLLPFAGSSFHEAVSSSLLSLPLLVGTDLDPASVTVKGEGLIVELSCIVWSLLPDGVESKVVE